MTGWEFVSHACSTFNDACASSSPTNVNQMYDDWCNHWPLWILHSYTDNPTRSVLASHDFRIVWTPPYAEGMYDKKKVGSNVYLFCFLFAMLSARERRRRQCILFRYRVGLSDTFTHDQPSCGCHTNFYHRKLLAWNLKNWYLPARLQTDLEQSDGGYSSCTSCLLVLYLSGWARASDWAKSRLSTEFMSVFYWTIFRTIVCQQYALFQKLQKNLSLTHNSFFLWNIHLIRMCFCLYTYRTVVSRNGFFQGGTCCRAFQESIAA